MLILIIIFSFITIFYLLITISRIIFSNNNIISDRLNKIGKSKTYDSHDELNYSLHDRIIKPIMKDFNKFISNIMPSEIKNKIETKLIEAGNPFGFSVEKWINFQLSLIIGLPIFTIIVALKGGAEFKKIITIIILEILLGLIMPRFILAKKVTERKNEIIRNLPDVLDLLTVSVEAGLGFDAAIAKVADKVPGKLSDEFLKVIQEIKIGVPKKEALRSMEKRVGVGDLTTFIGSIIQADQLGVSIGNVLRIQSKQMREKRRQRAQEKAMKAPVKMLFPMVFFIFPTIFAVLLGPIVIKLMNTFMK